VTIVRDAGGQYNFAIKARNKKSDRDRADSSKNASAEKQDVQLFLVASLNVTNGTLRYRDLKNGGVLTATQINLKVNDFEWDEPFDIQLEAAVMADKHNLKFKSRVGPIAGNRDYRDVPVDGDIHADDFDMGKVNTALPQFQGEFVLAGNIKIVKELTRLLDFSPRIVYNRFRLHDGGTINLKP
jgi:hypothetical protein